MLKVPFVSWGSKPAALLSECWGYGSGPAWHHPTILYTCKYIEIHISYICFFPTLDDILKSGRCSPTRTNVVMRMLFKLDDIVSKTGNMYTQLLLGWSWPQLPDSWEIYGNTLAVFSKQHNIRNWFEHVLIVLNFCSSPNYQTYHPNVSHLLSCRWPNHQ